MSEENDFQEQNDGTMGMMCEAAISDLDEQLSSRENALKNNLNTIKKNATVIICITIYATPGFVILSQREGLHCTPLSINGKLKLNASACLFNKQFRLLDNIYATVCNQDGYVSLDVRKFVNGTPTIIGVDLSLMQWLSLKQLTSIIDTAISEARTFWKKLKT